WRGVLRGIAVEEMLHLALVGNLMAAIGAAPTFGRPNFPQRSGYFPSGVQLALLPFREPLSPQELMPRGQEFLTVGHLYRGIEAGLRDLTERLGERGLFVGSPRAQ